MVARAIITSVFEKKRKNLSSLVKNIESSRSNHIDWNQKKMSSDNCTDDRIEMKGKILVFECTCDACGRLHSKDISAADKSIAISKSDWNHFHQNRKLSITSIPQRRLFNSHILRAGGHIIMIITGKLWTTSSRSPIILHFGCERECVCLFLCGG